MASSKSRGTDGAVELLERVGNLLAAFPPGSDASRVVDAVATETLGFYDPDEKEIFIERAARRSLDEFEASIVAHELEHALVDDALGLSEGDPRDDWGDSALAASSLVEGSATLTELRFLESLVDRTTFQLMLGSPATSELVTADLPHVLARSFTFPYKEGLGFVCELYADGGLGCCQRRLSQTADDVRGDPVPGALSRW